MAAAIGTHVVDAKTLLATPSELDVFSVPITQIGVNGSHWETVRSKNQLDSHGPWTFDLDTGGHYCLPYRNYMYLRLKIVRTDANVPFDDTDNVSPINKLGSTFFKTVKLYIGSKQVEDSYDLYPYRSMIETELNYGKETKECGHLRAALYVREEQGDSLDNGTNMGFIERSRIIAMGKGEIELLAPITCDLFNSNRVLPTHTKLRLEVYRNSNNFLLLNMNTGGKAARGYDIQVMDMFWQVHMLDLTKSASLGLEAALLKHPAKYPVRLTKMTRLSVSSGSNRTPQNCLFSGQVPRRLIIAQVERNAFNGAKKLSPFNFQNFGLEEITVTAGGVRYHREPLKMDFENGIYYRAYLQLLESLQMGAPHTQGCSIGPEMFAYGGRCFLAFDLSPDQTDGTYWDLTRTGNTYVEARYKRPLTKDIELVVYAEFDSLIRIDHNREPHLAHAV